MIEANRRAERRQLVAGLAATLLAVLLAAPARAETLNVYTAWPESLSQPIFKAYTAKTGVQINFIRLSTGELVARATAERNNPRADVIWGAPGDGFAAAKEAGILEPYRPPTWCARPSGRPNRSTSRATRRSARVGPDALDDHPVAVAHRGDEVLPSNNVFFKIKTKIIKEKNQFKYHS